MDHKPNWRERAEAAEYWIVCALCAGALVYGVLIGAVDLARLW